MEILRAVILVLGVFLVTVAIGFTVARMFREEDLTVYIKNKKKRKVKK